MLWLVPAVEATSLTVAADLGVAVRQLVERVVHRLLDDLVLHAHLQARRQWLAAMPADNSTSWGYMLAACAGGS